MSDLDELVAAQEIVEQTRARLVQVVADCTSDVIEARTRLAELERVRNDAIVEARAAGASRRAVEKAAVMSLTWVDKIYRRGRDGGSAA